MDTVLSIILKLFGEAWKKFCTLLPSQVALSCELTDQSPSHIVFTFSLRNTGNIAIREYALTLVLPSEVAEHLRSRMPGDNTPATLHFSGPQIWVQLDTFQCAPAKAADHPLLPAGPAIPVGLLDFAVVANQDALIDLLQKHPIRVEFWGGSGSKHEAILYLHNEKAPRYIESKRPFKKQISQQPLFLLDGSRR